MGFSRIRDQDLVLRVAGNELAHVGDFGGQRHRGLWTHTRADAATCATWIEPGNTKAYLAPANTLRSNWVNVNGVWRLGALLEGARTNRVENSDFETDITGLNANLATLTRDSAQAFRGAWAGKVTTQNSSGSGCYMLKRDGTRMSATASKLHTWSLWVYAPTASVGKSIQVQIEWYTAASGGVLISVSTTNITLAAGWNRYAITALAPGTTVAATPTFYTNGAIGVFDYWVDLLQFEEAAYASSAISTGTAAATRAEDALDVSIFADLMGFDWTMFLWMHAAQSNVASWADADSAELDPFILGLYPTTAGTDAADSLRLHRQNSATTYEWEYGNNTPTASRSFTTGTAAQKLCLRHRASDHTLECAIDGGAFAVSGVPAATTYSPFRLLRLGGNTVFSARTGFITLLDLQLAEGLFNPEDMLDPI